SAVNQCKYFTLASGERLIVLPQAGDFLLLLASGPTTFDGFADSVKQLLIPEGLCKEIHRTGFHRLDAHGNVGVGRDEDDRYFNLRGDQVLLKLEAACTWQPHIQYETTWFITHLMLLQELRWG